MTLYIISTPIGNIKDVTLRAIDTLKEVDMILAEDTRRTGILLKEYNIGRKRMISFNDHNVKRVCPNVIEELKKGVKVGLVSDNGTPGVSDPGFYIARECRNNGIEIVPVPGASAVLSALVCSGFPMERFVFYGFLSKKPGRRKKELEAIKEKEMTAVVYESPYRIMKLLKDVEEVMPEQKICVAREMTKKFEEFLIGTSAEVISKIGSRKLKGEICVVISC